MLIRAGEIYGKKNAGKFSMYNVVQVKRDQITLQNIDNPLSQFETTLYKLVQAGYVLISQRPFIDLQIKSTKKRKALKKPSRCPLTLGFIEQRADSERPSIKQEDLFTA